MAFSLPAFSPMEFPQRLADLRMVRGPSDTLRYQFEAVSRRSGHERDVIRELLDAEIVHNQVASAIVRVAKQVPTKSTGRSTRERSRTAHQE